MANCRLYLITPPRIEDPAAFTDLLDQTLAAGDVACLQIRLKDISDDEIKQVSTPLVEIGQSHDVAVLINDRPDLADALGADGAHIGQEDAPYAEARKILGADKIVGVTAHDSRHLAMMAGEAGADYVAFGAFFPTTTKDPKASATPDILQWWSSLFEVPCVAIGGITVDNCLPLLEAGADFLAVSAGIWQHTDGPAAAVQAFNRILSTKR